MVDPALYQKYPKEKIDEALALLTYKHTDPLPKNESNTLPTIYIFRHGQTVDNANFIFSGWRDSELTEKGREQAQILSQKLKDKKIQMLISSPQKRAVETMEIAVSLNKNVKDLKINMDDRIKERCYGDLQGQNKLTLQLENPTLLHEIRRSYTYIPPNGESLEIVCKRVKEFCDEIIPLIKHNNVNVAISCHGNSIRGFRKYFENLSNDVIAQIETPLAQDYASYIIH